MSSPVLTGEDPVMTFSFLPVRGLLLLVWLVAPSSALAQEPSRLMRPGQLDVHAEGGLSFIPPSFEAGASTEVGVVGLGPGTLSVGAQLGLRQCLLACSLSGVLALERVSTRDVHVLGRLGYHFTWPGKSQGKVDLQGALLGGVMEARILRDAPEFRYEGRGRGLAFGLAVGGNYFLSSRFFVGCEARLRFASGLYALSLTRGSYAFTQEDRQWVRLGLGTVFSAGVRLF
ncbi:hypothetical protein D187_005511 [Cystobacter fuscus DSM 2262]|uniref:Outer membrane protein beta-barrel domain-containing protein n=2 Tax=Cystobacter fuscus TaxID=43 RepID=S9PPG4_CYSF2|nr:hypothetical protein D187_005511 [Cystobacter fuscus DSM 2262]